jgi:translation elongation factor EF-Tu-like GTPase
MSMLFSNTFSIQSCIVLPEDSAMIMPGDAVTVQILLRKPMVLQTGKRFTIRENQITTVTGRLNVPAAHKNIPLVTNSALNPRNNAPI